MCVSSLCLQDACSALLLYLTVMHKTGLPTGFPLGSGLTGLSLLWLNRHMSCTSLMFLSRSQIAHQLVVASLAAQNYNNCQ